MRGWIVVLLVILFSVVGPVSSDAYRGKVTVVLTGEPPTMDPHQSSNANATIAWRWAYDTLLPRGERESHAQAVL